MSKGKESLEMKKKEIQETGLNAIKDFFNIDPYEDLDKRTIYILHNKARLAMQFEREMNLTRRSVELNYIRVFRMIAEDKTELKKLIKKSLPQYLR